MARFRMSRIEVPDWARPPDVRLHHMLLSDYHTIQAHRDRMLMAVHREVEEYMNTPGLYVEGDEEGYPDRSRMTGEYYVSHESYTVHVGLTWFQIGVMCHCLEKPWLKGQVVLDYFGLEVWLRCEPDDWSFSVFRNTDSSAI